MEQLKGKNTFNSILHYFLIYLLFIIPGSSLFQKILPKSFVILFFLIIIVFTLIVKKFRNYFTILPLVLIVFFAFIVRLISGGIGIYSIVDIVLPLFVLNIAVNFDKKLFLTRFVKLSIVFFSISLIMFLIQLINRDFYSLPIFQRYYSQTLGTVPWETDYYGNGFLLFSTYDIHPTRNCGIFTEPGVYQINIISCLSVLLFFYKDLLLSRKKINLFILISLLTLITCQSTTGFLALIVLLLVYAIFFKHKNKKIARYILSVSIFLFFFIIIDYYFKGEKSIIYTNFISKLFVDGKINFDSGTGQYRIGTLEIALNSMIKNPFGIGYDQFNLMNVSTNAGAGYFVFGAVYGIIPFIILFAWMVYPYILKKKYMFLLLFLLLFFNTSMAQTYFFYPGLFIISYYIYFNADNKQKKAILWEK